MVNVKPEPSQEGNLIPYVIQPMADLPPKIKKKRSSKKLSVSTVLR